MKRGPPPSPACYISSAALKPPPSNIGVIGAVFFDAREVWAQRSESCVRSATGCQLLPGVPRTSLSLESKSSSTPSVLGAQLAP